MLCKSKSQLVVTKKTYLNIRLLVQVLAMPLPPELELWKVKLNAFHRLSWKFVEGLLVRISVNIEGT